MKAEELTKDALDVIVDIVMVTTARLPKRRKDLIRYWLDVTSDWWYEWCDRCTWEAVRGSKNNATITT